MQSVARPGVEAVLAASEAKLKMSGQLYEVKQQTLKKLQGQDDPVLQEQARQAFLSQEKTAQKLREKHRQDLLANETVQTTEEEAALPLLDESDDAFAEGLSDAVGLVMKVSHPPPPSPSVLFLLCIRHVSAEQRDLPLLAECVRMGGMGTCCVKHIA